jgi:V-type H+-transporting ATPase subunit E
MISHVSPSAQSNLTNKSRLKLLQRREEHLQNLFDSSREAVLELAKDEGRYAQFLEGFIVQGFLQLMESSVTILARKKDAAIVEKASENASKAYHDISGRKLEYTVDASLSDDG